MSEEYQPRYKWRQTWPEKGEDYECVWNGISVGRIYRIIGGPQDRMWFWTQYAHQDTPTRIPANSSGVIDGTARDAAKIVEEAFDAARERWGDPRPSPWPHNRR
ncbi:hypothetical protein [Jiella marina]|uniref:hypothetical protein n=1 Tax=Jiella sp. LLJ827 TaxID=2917712 RepID=UPI002101C289|nr:hypothetical protein [Jiella sp. LLJ827]MCQ0986380.1 hypothetical protein [Jiella sp. LLJ827]